MTGRPKKQINKDQFEKLCALQCTKEEFQAFFDCCDETIDRWIKETYVEEFGSNVSFSEVFRVKRGAGKLSLRRHQFKLAEKNAAMAIFLGKNYLDQTDQTHQKVELKEVPAFKITKYGEDEDATNS